MVTPVLRRVPKPSARRWTLLPGLLAATYALCTVGMYLHGDTSNGIPNVEDSVRAVGRDNGDPSRQLLDEIQNPSVSTEVDDSKIHKDLSKPTTKNASLQSKTTTIKGASAASLPTSQLRAAKSAVVKNSSQKEKPIAAVVTSQLRAANHVPSLVVKNSFQKEKPIAVVFANVKYDDFVQNCFKSFNLYASTAQFLAVGVDEESTELFRTHGIPSISMDGILSELGDSNALSTASKEVAPVKTESFKSVYRLCCRRLEVGLAMLKGGFSVFMLDSDIALTSSPWFGSHTDLLEYVQAIDADIVTGHGTHPPASFAKRGFTIQTGFRYTKPTPAVIHLMEEVVGSCQAVDGDDQTLINEVFDDHYDVAQEPVPEADIVGTRIYQATSEDKSVEKLKVGVLGSKFFPTGCKYIAEADEFPMIRHPGCVPGVISNAAYKRMPSKVQSLIRQGAWYINDHAHKAILWSYPGSGNTMLRFTFERIVGKIGSTNSIYHDRTLGLTLPGELYSDGGLLVKVHPGVPKGPEAMEKEKDLVFKNTPKRIIVVRDPYDSIWSWYQLLVTGSHTGRVSMEDFSIEHFAAQAILWAKKFQIAAQEEMIPFARDHPNDLLLIRFEDLMKEQDKYLHQILDFIDEKPAGEYSKGKLGIIDHPSIRRDAKKDTDVSKAFAYGHPDLVNQMWKILSASSKEYGYKKPEFGGAAKTQVASKQPSKLPTHARGGRHRYFTFYPTGGLSNQLLELEVAVELAQRSNRTLLLPPLVAESIKIFPQVWTDDSEKRYCTNETVTMSSCNYDLSKVQTQRWDQLIDIEHLATRVPVVQELPPDVMSKMSQLTLCEYHKCNTRWMVRDLMEEESCLPGYVSDHSPAAAGKTNNPVVRRSAMCVFNSAKGINIVKFGALLGVSPVMPPPTPKFLFKKAIRDASEEIADKLRALSPDSVYNCAHLRVAGSVWEKDSPFVADRESNVEMQVNFLESVDPEKKNPVFIATDNEEYSRSIPSICGVRKCYFASDFKDITDKHGLTHFQHLIPVDYTVCGSATEAKASVRSSVGYIIKVTHLNQKLARGEVSIYQPDGEYAYVTLLARNPDEKQRSMYVTAVRALIRSLQESGTTADIVVLMMYVDAEVKKTLQADGAIVKHVEPLAEPKKVDDFLPWFASAALAKLRVFELTQYKRIQFLDADVVLLENAKLDSLFSYEFGVPLVTEGLGTDSPIRGGWFMVRPSGARFKVLQALVKRGDFSKAKGWDQRDLAVDLPGWEPKSNTNKWGFYGSQLEQGK